MKDFDRWNEIKKEINNKSNKIILKEGEIYWCKFGINVGNETRGKGKYFKRPVLILRKFTRDVFFGVPLTSKEKHGNWYFKIIHNNKINYLILNQVKLMDKKRLEERIYQISEKELRTIKEKLCSLILRKY
ncbi:MAG: hypothetical protein RLY49_207 [Candidatus Parcubacteria bacterium]|jgi:mRNA-degrading endonuclease toxin of MazEF toxin-antitoxin module